MCKITGDAAAGVHISVTIALGSHLNRIFLSLGSPVEIRSNDKEMELFSFTLVCVVH